MSEATTQTQTPSETTTKPKPVAKVDKYWPIRIAIWENVNDEGRMSHSFTISRTYKDEAGEYHDTSTMFALHVTELRMAIDDAWRWIKTVGRQRAFEHQQPRDVTSDASQDVTLNVPDDGIPF